jgi:hypothetical protein
LDAGTAVETAERYADSLAGDKEISAVTSAIEPKVGYFLSEEPLQQQQRQQRSGQLSTTEQSYQL